VVFGKAEERMQEIVFQVVDRLLRQAGWPLVPQLSDSEAALVRTCLGKEDAWRCIEPMASKKGVRRIVAVRVELDHTTEGASQVVLTGRLVYVGSSSVLEQKRYCGACSDAELISYAEEIAKLLMDERAVQAGTTKVAVHSEPLGAEVLIDGKVVGITNETFATFPGKHTVELRLSGRKSVSRSVTAIDGRTVEVAVELELVGGQPVAPPAPTERGAPTLVPKLVAAAGGALMIAGGILVALDEKQRTLPAAELAKDPTYFDSAPGGVALLVGGAVAAGVGGYLWWRSGTGKPMPTVATSSQGVVVGLVGSF
jgi:PEGA domain